ncbi:hypothetical protein O0I10_003382 [Lichtheimia ornata]|uniref:Breast carcinoma amplified sequence 2 n=1 Tax=Lichtheimia ornata TaxID=688661 RepID=A0AAD7XXH2_9FUNG|nr:uncharacterized protein O0I10_003382 [Lichtheimia ornata]KAJ8660739.1 hypothetical protein O0I10_003382 [Lichtheimia ornata]
MTDNALVAVSSSTSALRSDSDVDALPYVDREVDDPELKAAVDRLLDQEMRRMRRRDDRCPLPTQVELFQDNATLKEEWDRAKQKQPLNVLDTERYELKGPANDDDIEGWQKAVDNTKSQLESQAGSMFNLELLQKYGANAWRVHNYQLESQLKMLQKETEEYREKIREISRERKNEQTQAGGSLRSLENKWSDLITQNLQVEIACASLEQEVEELQRYKEMLEAKKKRAE